MRLKRETSCVVGLVDDNAKRTGEGADTVEEIAGVASVAEQLERVVARFEVNA